MRARTTGEVLLDHLELAQRGDVDTDVERNFTPTCVLLTTYGIFRGHAGVREAAALLDRQIGPATYAYLTKCWEGEVGFLEWTADTERASVPDGADSYLVRDGRIHAMTIHYTVVPRAAS